MWTFRGGGSRRRRGCHVRGHSVEAGECHADIPWRRVAATPRMPRTWTFRGGGLQRLPHGSSAGTRHAERGSNTGKDALGYERAPLLYADDHLVEPVDNDRHLAEHRDHWRAGVAARRRRTVRDLAGRALDACHVEGPRDDDCKRTRFMRWDKSESSTEAAAAPGSAEDAARGRRRIRGYEQLYELLEQRANLEGLEALALRTADAVLEGLAPHASVSRRGYVSRYIAATPVDIPRRRRRGDAAGAARISPAETTRARALLERKKSTDSVGSGRLRPRPRRRDQSRGDE